MARIYIPSDRRELTDPSEIRGFLSDFGIWYRRFERGDDLGERATDEEILAAYDAPLQELMAAGDYKTADVINITPDVPNLQVMLDKFNKEHWHSENEVRFIVKGRAAAPSSRWAPRTRRTRSASPSDAARPVSSSRCGSR